MLTLMFIALLIRILWKREAAGAQWYERMGLPALILPAVFPLVAHRY